MNAAHFPFGPRVEKPTSFEAPARNGCLYCLFADCMGSSLEVDDEISKRQKHTTYKPLDCGRPLSSESAPRQLYTIAPPARQVPNELGHKIVEDTRQYSRGLGGQRTNYPTYLYTRVRSFRWELEKQKSKHQNETKWILRTIIFIFLVSANISFVNSATSR